MLASLTEEPKQVPGTEHASRRRVAYSSYRVSLCSAHSSRDGCQHHGCRKRCYPLLTHRSDRGENPDIALVPITKRIRAYRTSMSAASTAYIHPGEDWVRFVPCADILRLLSRGAECAHPLPCEI